MRDESKYPKAFRVGYLEQTMEEATNCLRILVGCSERYPEQIERCDERMRQEFQELLWKAAKPR